MAGSQEPSADAEVIALANQIITNLGVKDVELHINSIGCPTCRKRYHDALREYFLPHQAELCETCQERLEKNPMRLLDCKSPICKEIGKDAPVILDYLCDDCKAHFEELQERLKGMGIDFVINPTIVRGLDYYTKTVFEFVSEDIGSQGTVCGGGRYDGLIETLSDKPCPALGFGMGLERLILTMENQGVEFAEEETCDIYIGSMGDAAAVKAMQICRALRTDGVRAECDVVGRSVRAQMKYADKLNAKFSVVIGDSELEAGKATLKDMKSGEQTDIPLDERFGNVFNAMLISRALDEDGLGDAISGLM